MTWTDDEEFRVSELERLLRSVLATQGRWQVNGADSFFQESGFRFGDRVDIGDGGVQIKAPISNTVYALVFVPDFVTNVESYITDGGHLALISAYANATSGTTEMSIGTVTAEADATANTLIVASSAVGQVTLQVSSDDSNDRLSFDFTGAPIKLSVFDADPAVLEDGMVWYRSDTDTFKGRANGATVTFTVS